VIELDGNAIAGDMANIFGVDLTMARATCAHCGATSFLAESVVYMRGPGDVARCRTCAAVLMVLVTIHGVTCVDLQGMAQLELPEAL
jgi:hypothetical protein